MYEALEAEVRRLGRPGDAASFRELVRISDLLAAHIATAAAEYEASGAHEVDGSLSMRTWLVQHTGMDPSTATKTIHRGRKLRALPRVSSALEDGELTGGQVEVVLGHVPERHLERFGEQQDDLVPLLADLSMSETVRAMDRWRAMADAEADEAAPPDRENEAFLSRTIHGRGELRASMDADLTATVEAALRAADRKDFSITPAERRADGLGTVCQFYLDHHRSAGRRRNRPHVNIIVSLDDLEQGLGGRCPETGARLSAEETAVACCDAVLHRLTLSQGAILDYGRGTRAVPVDLDRVLVLRDQGCRWPGCERPVSHTDAHHVRPWEHGGTTSLDNLVLVCRRHHRLAHRRGWATKLLPDGTFVVTNPKGLEDSTGPPLVSDGGHPPRHRY